MFSFFAHPELFYGLIVLLLVVSFLVFLAVGREDKKNRKLHEAKLLEAQLRVCELEKSLSTGDGLRQKLGQLQVELDKANKELSLSNQMYNGLKGQYDELEDKFSQLFEESLPEQKKIQPQNPPPGT